MSKRLKKIESIIREVSSNRLFIYWSRNIFKDENFISYRKSAPWKVMWYLLLVSTNKAFPSLVRTAPVLMEIFVRQKRRTFPGTTQIKRPATEVGCWNNNVPVILLSTRILANTQWNFLSCVCATKLVWQCVSFPVSTESVNGDSVCQGSCCRDSSRNSFSSGVLLVYFATKHYTSCDASKLKCCCDARAFVSFLEGWWWGCVYLHSTWRVVSKLGSREGMCGLPWH